MSEFFPLVSFERALVALKAGYKARREGWAQGLYIELLTDTKGSRHIYGGIPGSKTFHSFDQSELLAEDWQVL